MFLNSVFQFNQKVKYIKIRLYLYSAKILKNENQVRLK